MTGIIQGLLASISSAVASAASDAYFNLTTLLLNTTSTNGAQNNTFLDSSTNNFSITRNGNTTQGTFTPFSQTGWSNGVTATGSYLTVTSQPLINVNDWTVEFWMYPTQFNNNGGIFGASNGGGTIPKLYLYVTGANIIIEGYSGGFFTALSTAQPTLNQWTYVSVSRSSSTGNAYLYYNGVLQGSAAAVPAITGITGGFSLFSNGEGSSAGFYGYMSDMRVSNVARYTGSSYSVPTAPLTAIANTTLLTAQSNSFVDKSSNGYAIASTGSPSVQAFSPFNPTAAYDAAVVGGSAYFDGSGDYLTSASSANLAVGTGDFTYEFWLYPHAANSDNCIFDTRAANNNTSGFAFLIRSSANLEIYTNTANLVCNGAIKQSMWQHVALVRSGSTVTAYVNGVSVGSATFSNNLTDQTLSIASYVGAGSSISAYISGFRLVKGTAVYTATFTPPTSPATAITNTQILLSATNSGIFDSTAKNVLETVGNAQVSTTQAKWGTTSMYFDGTGDNLAFPKNELFNFGTGDFTIEFWFYPPSVSYGAIMYSTNNGSKTDTFAIYSYGSGQSPANSIVALVTASGGGAWSLFNNQLIGATTAATWQHVALVRNGSTFKGYMNGVAGFTVTSSSAIASFNGFSIASNGASGDYLTGYIDDLRITRYARYTADFTPPAAAFALQ